MFKKINDKLTSENNFIEYKVNLTIMNKNQNVFVFSQSINDSCWIKNDFLF